MNEPIRPRKQKINYERRIWIMASMSGLPGVLIAMLLLWKGDYSAKVQWTLAVLLFGFWFGFGFALREHVVHPLLTLSNLLAGLREGDYPIRARATKG